MQKTAIDHKELRPRIKNRDLWYPERLKKGKWNKIRKIVLERDDYTCFYCGHKAKKWMNVHHINHGDDNDIDNLITLCVACHAVLHIGRNAQLGIIQIWKCDIPQVEIVKQTRKAVRSGNSLSKFNRTLPIREGKYPPEMSVMYANNLIDPMDNSPNPCLPLPLCVIFVNLQRWQLE